MIISELLFHINKFAPFSVAEEWDNSGLIVGSEDDIAEKIGVCLDATFNSVEEAAQQGCNVLVCHHPLIFKPVKQITDSTPQGQAILAAIRHGINVIAVHTNWDKALDGVNETLARLIGLQKIVVLDGETGFGSCGVLKKPMEIAEFLEHVKSSWHLSHIDCYKQDIPFQDIKKVAICGGSGAEFWREAQEWGADIYLTADMKYHELIDAINEYMMVGLVDHGEMERTSLPVLAKKFKAMKIDTVIIDDTALPQPLRI